MRPLIALTAAVLCLTVTRPAAADFIIVNQPATGSDSNRVNSQQYVPEVGGISCRAFDDFVLGGTFNLTTFRAFGFNTGNSGLNTAVTAEIRLAPDAGTPFLLSAAGTQVGNDLIFDFGGAPLGPGTYWITAFVTRPLGGGGGQWFWRFHSPVTGSEAMWQNPLGGFGAGTTPFNVGDLPLVNGPTDLAFRLEAVPAPPAVILVGIGLAAGFTVRRLRRLAGAATPA